MPVPSFVAGTALRRLPVSGAPPRGFAYDFAPEPYPDGQWRLSPGHVLSVSLRAAPGRVAGPVPPVSTRVALLRPPPLQVQIARSLAMLQPFSTAEGPGVGTGPSHAMMHCRALRRPLAALAVSAVLVALACATSQVGGAALPLRCPGLFASSASALSALCHSPPLVPATYRASFLSMWSSTAGVITTMEPPEPPVPRPCRCSAALPGPPAPAVPEDILKGHLKRCLKRASRRLMGIHISLRPSSSILMECPPHGLGHMCLGMPLFPAVGELLYSCLAGLSSSRHMTCRMSHYRFLAASTTGSLP